MKKIQVTNFYDITINYKENYLFHRPDGPAIESSDGYKEWQYNGYKHRLDGPAVTYPSGYEEYWEHGRNIENKASGNDKH